jgi:hypothetical protein
MYWEVGIRFLIISVHSYVRHFFKHSKQEALPRI